MLFFRSVTCENDKHSGLASILGLFILFFALKSKLLPAHWVSASCRLFIGIMPLFFIPASMGLLDHFQTLMANGAALVGATVISSFIIFVAISLGIDKVERGNR